MRRTGHSLALCAFGLIGSVSGLHTVAVAGEATEVKGAKIYCFMRSSGNDHSVSWNASYAVIKRQGNGMFKTSPEHASVMITEAVVKDPGNFPDCGQYLGDLFGGSGKGMPAGTVSTASPEPNVTNGFENSFEDDESNRYSY